MTQKKVLFSLLHFHCHISIFSLLFPSIPLTDGWRTSRDHRLHIVNLSLIKSDLRRTGTPHDQRYMFCLVYIGFIICLWCYQFHILKLQNPLKNDDRTCWGRVVPNWQRWALPQIRKLRTQVSICGFANLISYRKHLRTCGEQLKFTANPQSNRQCCLFRGKTAWKEWTLLFSGLITFFFWRSTSDRRQNLTSKSKKSHH